MVRSEGHAVLLWDIATWKFAVKLPDTGRSIVSNAILEVRMSVYVAIMFITGAVTLALELLSPRTNLSAAPYVRTATFKLHLRGRDARKRLFFLPDSPYFRHARTTPSHSSRNGLTANIPGGFASS